MKIFIFLMVVLLHIHSVFSLYHHLNTGSGIFAVLFAFLFFIWGIWLLKRAFDLNFGSG